MAKAKAKDTKYEQIAQDGAELHPLDSPQAQFAPEDVLNEIARPLRETLPEVGRRIFGLVETARRVQDPTRLRAFLTRSLLRVVDLAATDPRYGPHVRWCVELGVSAVLLPAEHRTNLGRAAWAVMVHCLQKLSPDVETPAQRLADRAAIVASALALSLSTEELEHSNRWVEEAALQCFLLVSDASAPTCASRDEALLGDCLCRDLETLVGLPATARAFSPWVDGPMGELWPRGVPSGVKEPDLAELRRWADELTRAAERTNLRDMAGREASRKPAAESPKDALEEALGAFSGLTPPRLPVRNVDQITPENAAEVLDALSVYLNEAGEAVVALMRLVLHELRGKSFASLAETKEFASRFQRILDRVNQAVECPSCGELGKYEGVSHHTVATGMVRVKHPGRTTHAGTTVVTELPIKKQS